MRNIILRKLCLLSILFAAIAFMHSVSGAAPKSNLLSVEQAFTFQAVILKNNILQLDWFIAPDYFLYQDQLHVINENNTSLLKANLLPAGLEKNDEFIGKVVLYSNKLTINIPLNIGHADNRLLVRYQGCADSGFCYAPQQKQLHINADQSVDIVDTDLEQFPNESEVDGLVAGIQHDYLPLTLGLFFLFGILLSFSPCVLPMIPLIVNLIVGCKKISTHKAAVLTSCYILGMAGTYAIAGSIAGMLGARFQVWLQMPIVLISFSSLLIVIALAQLDLIKITIPSFNRRLHHWGQKQLQGSLIGAFILGIISSLIISPCVTPPLIGVLTYIGQSGSAFIGGMTLFFLGLGMGVPLIVVAMLSSVILPSAGHWMNLIKIFAAMALLGLAIWIISSLISTDVILMLCGGLCVIFATYLRHFRKHIKTAGAVMAILGGALIAIAIDYRYEIFFTRAANTKNHSKWQNISSMEQLQQNLEQAKSTKQLVLVDVYADWCASCRQIEQGVFGDPKVIRALQNYKLLRIDLTKITTDKDLLLDELEIYGPPAILFYSDEAVELKEKRVVGSIDAEEMLEKLGP